MNSNVFVREKADLRQIMSIGLGFLAFMMISFGGTNIEARTLSNQPLQMIVPYGAGSGSDLIARAIQPYVEKHLGARVIISNVPGADSRIGMKKLFAAKPDSPTIGLCGFPTPIIHEYLYDVPYKALDFSFVYSWIMSPQVIFIAENSPWKNFDDFIIAARKKPVTFGLPGFGTSVHLLAMALEKQMSLKFTYIPYSGSADGFTALAGNHIDANVAGADAALGLVQAKKIRPIFAWSFNPHASFPDVPLSTKYNVSTFVLARGVFGPPNMPKDRVRLLETAFARAAAEPQVMQWSKSRGYDVIAWDAKQFHHEVEKQHAMIDEYKKFLKTP